MGVFVGSSKNSSIPKSDDSENRSVYALGYTISGFVESK